MEPGGPRKLEPANVVLPGGTVTVLAVGSAVSHVHFSSSPSILLNRVHRARHRYGDKVRRCCGNWDISYRVSRMEGSTEIIYGLPWLLAWAWSYNQDPSGPLPSTEKLAKGINMSHM